VAVKPFSLTLGELPAMSQILLLTSSLRGDASYSTRVARALVEQLQAATPGATVTVRDLAGAPLPPIDADFIAGQALPPEKRSAAQAAAVALSDRLVQEVRDADAIVVASGMVNFSLASGLKTWFDYLLRAGVTFRYTETGPEGLVTGKTAYLVTASGGVYSEGPRKAIDFQEPYLRQLLAFIGITDVTAIAVEGVAFGPEAADKAVAGALAKIPAVVARAA
jgi:FMN-dependent NADH-azoreductase